MKKIVSCKNLINAPGVHSKLCGIIANYAKIKGKKERKRIRSLKNNS